MNDQGYKAVMKEYDFYNSNDNDFEIIDECPTNYVNSLPENNIANNFTHESVKLQNFFVNIFKIIFSSRNKRSEFSSKSKKNLDNSSFIYDIEELIEYDNLKAHDNKKKKYIIEFYLYEKDNDDNLIKSMNIRDKPKILVERWKIKYKENLLPLDVDDKKDSFKNYDLFLDKKMKIIEKNIIAYSRVLPLFNILKENKYYIDFKFNPIKKNHKMKFVDENATKTINLISDDMFCFKLSVEYLNIKPETISMFFNKIDSDFVIIPSNKSRKRFLSDDYKKSSSQLLKKLEQKDKDNINDNNDEEKDNNNNYINRRRLSFEENYYNKKYNPNFEEENNSSSEDDLSLVITETNNDTCQTSSDNHKNSENTRKITDKTDNNNQINNKQNILSKGHVYKEKPKSILAKDKKRDILKNIDFSNSSFAFNIIKDYKSTRQILELLPNFGNINNNRLFTFISSS